MAAKPLTTEAIALTEKKMDMALDDIIKMSKNNSNKPKKQQRAPNKGQKSGRSDSVRAKALKVQQYMNSRSFVRQGALAQRRSNFQGNQFPLAADAARKAAFAPLRVRAFNGGRVANMNKTRFDVSAAQRRATNGVFAAKPQHHQQHHQQQEQQASMLPKQRTQTLDSLFANMKEERMRASFRPKNTAQRDGGWQRRPWGREPLFPKFSDLLVAVTLTYNDFWDHASKGPVLHAFVVDDQFLSKHRLR